MNNEQFFDDISKLEKEMIAFKSKQLTGSGNITSYLTETSSIWDLSQTASTTGSSWYGKYGNGKLVFTADTQPAALVAFTLQIMIDGVVYYNQSKQLGGTQWIVYSGFGTQGSADKNIAKYQTGIGIIWGVNAGTTLQIKARAISTDTGILTFTTSVNGS